MNKNPIVTILMPTYNHERYISQAIESVLAQKTNYPYELLIHDDCSTDSTLAIAQNYTTKYPDKIKIFTEEENQGLLKSYKRLIEQSNGKYLAILESDDYWLDENKLQIQIDFLESNSDYGIVAGDIISIDENGNIIAPPSCINTHIRNTNRWYEKLLGNNGIYGACSVVFRKSDFLSYCDIDSWIENSFVTFDHPTWLSISFHKKCKYFAKTLAAYRIVSTSISNNANKEKQLDFSVKIATLEEFIVSKYGYGNLSALDYNQKICLDIAGRALKRKQEKTFYIFAKKLKPISIKQKFMRYFPHLYYWQFIIRH